MSTRKLLQRVLPVVVSAGTLIWVFHRFDIGAVADALSWRVGVVLVPSLVLYGATTLCFEAWSLISLLPRRPNDFGAWTAARIKCASYLVAIVNYALGGAALTVLLRKRARIGLGEAASVVLLISMTDLIIVLTVGALAAAFADAGGPAVRAGVVGVAGVAFFGGLALLRMPRSLGPLDRLRSLAVFEALRDTPGAVLARLGLLRLLFTFCFLGISAAAFIGFDIAVSPTRLTVGMMILAVWGALPIAVAGLGTSQIAAVYVFKGLAPPETLVAMSLVLSTGMLTLRAAMGIVFAREYTREALEETTREATA